MAKKNIKLTKEEKIILKYYNTLSKKKASPTKCIKELKKFCQEYVDEVKRNTKFEKEEISIKEEKNPKNAGGMSTEENGKTSILKVNFACLVNEKALLSNEEGVRFKNFTDLVDTLNHEMQHYMDLKNVENYRFSTRGMSLDKCVEIVSENLASMTDEYSFYSQEEGNYENVILEGDARRTGAIKTSTQLIRIDPDMPLKYKEYLANKVKDSIIKDNIDFEKLKYDNSEKKYDRTDVTSAYVDEIIAARPGLLQKSPFDVMKYEYREDGSRYTFDELIKQRDEMYEDVKNSNRLNKQTKKSMYMQLNTAYSRAMYNSLRRIGPEEIVDIRRRIGDKAFLNELTYVRQGKINSTKEKLSRFDEHINFFAENKDLLKRPFVKEIEECYDNVYKKSGYTESLGIDGEEYEDLENSEIDYLRKIKKSILKTRNDYSLYTEEEKAKKDAIREVRRKESLENLKGDFEDRKKVIAKKRARDKMISENQRRRQEELKRKQLEQKLKNPFFRLAYNINRRIERGKRKLIGGTVQVISNKEKEEQPVSAKQYLSDKREMVEKMQNQKQELEDRFENIVNESKETLLKAEEKIEKYKGEKKETVKEENIYEQRTK